MNYSEVKELLQAGFTADEIRTMLTTNPQNSQNNPQPEEPGPVVEAQENEALRSDVHQDQEAEAQKDDAKFNQLNETMTKILSAIQSANLQNNSFDSINKTDLNSEVDKIMGSIIRPERKEGGFNS